MSEKPVILVIGGTEQDRERLLDEIFQKLHVMERSAADYYFRVRSTDHPWEELRLRSLRSYS